MARYEDFVRRVTESELVSDFERQIPWGDDERHYYHPKKKKASVFSYFVRLEAVIDLVRKYSSGLRVLDMACAQGNFALLLAEGGFEVTALDLSEEFLAYAKKKYTQGKIEFTHTNIMDYASSALFDTVICGEIIEHVAYPKDLLAAVKRNLKVGGHLVLTTPNGNEWGSSLKTYSEVDDVSALIPRQFHFGDHLFLYTEEELRSLLNEAGFEVVEAIKFNSSYLSQMKGFRYLLPYHFLRWLEKQTRNWKKHGKDSSNGLIVVAKKTYVS